MADDERDEDLRPEEEEEEEEEWTEPASLEGLGNGNSTIFVGGFSAVKDLATALALWRDKDDQIVVMSGTYSSDVSLDANGHQGLRLSGDATAEASSIVFTGLLDVASTAGAKPPTSAVEAEAQDDDDGDAAEKRVEPPRPLTIGHMTFLAGAVFSETSHVAVNDCTFGQMFIDDKQERVLRTVRCHGLSTVEFKGCTAYGMERSAVYCYPHARSTFSNCTFVGAKRPPPPPTEQERRRRRQTQPVAAPPSVPASCECEVGVHLDDASSTFLDCVVNNFGIGVALNDACRGCVIERCALSEIATVGILLGPKSQPAIRNSSAKLCGRECAVLGSGSHPTMRNNVFVGDVRLKEGAVVTGVCDNVLGLQGNLFVEGKQFTVKGFTPVSNDPTLIKPKKVTDEEEE